MSNLRKLIERDGLRRDLMLGMQIDDWADDAGAYPDIDAADELMRRAAEEIDAMQAEAAAMSAVMRQIRETLPHVEVVQGADREIVNDLIRRADAALVPATREG